MSTLLASPRLAFLKKDSYMARLVIVFLLLLSVADREREVCTGENIVEVAVDGSLCLGNGD